MTAKLPPIHSRFLEGQGATIDRIARSDMPVISDATNCDHYFIQKKTTEIECRSCGWGLFIDPLSDKVLEGHLYKADKLII